MKAIEFFRRQWLAAVVGLLLTSLLVGGIVGRRSAQTNLPVIKPAYNFRLIDTAGQSVSLADSSGKVRLIAFIYTRCTTSCPVITHKMVNLQQAMMQQHEFGKQVEFISVTVDPTYDTPSVLKRYAAEAGANAQGWEFLTGQSAEVSHVLKQYGLYAQPVASGQIIHTVVEFLIDGQGRIRQVYGLDLNVEQTEKDILTLVRQTHPLFL